MFSPGLHHEREEAARKNVKKKNPKMLKRILLPYILCLPAALSTRDFHVKTKILMPVGVGSRVFLARSGTVSNDP